MADTQGVKRKREDVPKPKTPAYLGCFPAVVWERIIFFIAHMLCQLDIYAFLRAYPGFRSWFDKLVITKTTRINVQFYDPMPSIAQSHYTDFDGFCCVERKNRRGERGRHHEMLTPLARAHYGYPLPPQLTAVVRNNDRLHGCAFNGRRGIDDAVNFDIHNFGPKLLRRRQRVIISSVRAIVNGHAGNIISCVSKVAFWALFEAFSRSEFADVVFELTYVVYPSEPKMQLLHFKSDDPNAGIATQNHVDFTEQLVNCSLLCLNCGKEAFWEPFFERSGRFTGVTVADMVRRFGDPDVMMEEWHYEEDGVDVEDIRTFLEFMPREGIRAVFEFCCARHTNDRRWRDFFDMPLPLDNKQFRRAMSYVQDTLAVLFTAYVLSTGDLAEKYHCDMLYLDAARDMHLRCMTHDNDFNEDYVDSDDELENNRRMLTAFFMHQCSRHMCLGSRRKYI